MKPSEYHRVTRTCNLEGMSDGLATAIRGRMATMGYGVDSLPQAVCCETLSVRQKRGLFGNRQEQTVAGVVLGNGWLVWAVQAGNEAPVALSVQLSDVSVEDYETSAMSRLVTDSGIIITGMPAEVGQVGSVFLGFGQELAAREFREAIVATKARL